MKVEGGQAKETPSGMKTYGTFAGVFTPTLLTILGVIMYLRLGWVVGNAGLLGALLIVLLAVSITLSTALSMASIATNKRLSAGGPYAIISRALGLEVGGSIGIPVYLSQTLASAMYVFGFRAGWLYLFPEHDPMVVDLIAFAFVFGVAYISAGLAFKIQYLIMALVAFSLFTVFANFEIWETTHKTRWWGEFRGGVDQLPSSITFWVVFAVFFPATTGIMAGANMSGELRDSRRSIALGTLLAVGLSTIIYLFLCFWYARAGTSEELLGNLDIMADKALFSWPVLAGLIGATFSQSLASLVGSSRILMAMGEDRVIPKGKWMARRASQGEPRRALFISGGVVLVALMLRDLNLIAPLITMFFLITYSVINLVLVIELSLNRISFRPSFRVPIAIPIFGFLGCVVTMFVIHPLFSLIAVVMVLLIPIKIVNEPGSLRPADSRSGIFVALAEWAIDKVRRLDMTNKRSWRPDVLVPVMNPEKEARGAALINDICTPEGTVLLLGLTSNESLSEVKERIKVYSNKLRKSKISVLDSVIEKPDSLQMARSTLRACTSGFIRPNILFNWLSEEDASDIVLELFVEQSSHVGMGLMLYAPCGNNRLPRLESIDLWLKPPRNFEGDGCGLDLSQMNLLILTGIRLARETNVCLKLITVVDDEKEKDAAECFLSSVIDQCRLPRGTEVCVFASVFEEALANAQMADLHLIGLPMHTDLARVRYLAKQSREACLFIRDCGEEDALA